MTNWSEMNEDILSLIITKLKNPSHHIQISSVCSSWRSIALKFRYTLSHPIPSIMVSLPQHPHQRTFINFLVNPPPFDHSHQYHTIPSSYTCIGSYLGWLVLTVHDKNSIFLFNPFINKFRSLPKLQKEKVIKAVISCSPSIDSECVVLILFSKQGAAFCRVGDVSWTNFDHFFDENECEFSDALFFEGTFYLVDEYGKIYTCNLDIGLILEISFQPSDLTKIRHKYYLVEFDGKLCRVFRRFSFNESFYYENNVINDDNNVVNNNGYVTREFRICKMDPGKRNWVGVDSIGEYAMFLGMNNSICISEVEVGGIKGNRIYFTDDRQRNVKHFGFIWPGKDVGIYDLDDSSFQMLCETQCEWLKDPCAIWVAPLPW
ncbi:putative F-box protein At5g55150 [Beta vulgaris subsp. vulgaris]|uniref:putative F-box protein At5g55150 n=1 Tax=Beta vulgaris subsp. vulgaris TaxID=3555 RepID=UPI002036A239|nr:putative F-box protein At5g55150 [Beta vulgaris subsp. vulgaris]